MKSTPEQTQKRRLLKKMTVYLGELAWRVYPEIASHAIIDSFDTPTEDPRKIDYDEFCVYSWSTDTLPALKTKGFVYLRFRRRITRDRKYRSLWHFWEPGYAATKPESVDALLPVLEAQIESLESKLKPSQSAQIRSKGNSI